MKTSRRKSKKRSEDLENKIKNEEFNIRLNWDNQEKNQIKIGNEFCGYLRLGYYNGKDEVRGYCHNKEGICQHYLNQYQDCKYIPRGER